LNDTYLLQHNITITNAFLELTNPSITAYGGRLIHDVHPEIITSYLSNYKAHYEATAFRPMALGRWIMSRVAKGELVDWTIFVASPEDRKAVRMGTLELGLVERRRNSSHSIGTLLDPRHEGVDFPEGPSTFRRASGSYDAEAMRRARPVTRGLMIIYPLDPRFLGVEDKVPTVIGLALSLPFTTDIGAEWIVNTGVANG
jgi:hypothetical protein